MHMTPDLTSVLSVLSRESQLLKELEAIQKFKSTIADFQKQIDSFQSNGTLSLTTPTLATPLTTPAPAMTVGEALARLSRIGGSIRIKHIAEHPSNDVPAISPHSSHVPPEIMQVLKKNKAYILDLLWHVEKDTLSLFPFQGRPIPATLIRKAETAIRTTGLTTLTMMRIAFPNFSDPEIYAIMGALAQSTQGLIFDAGTSSGRAPRFRLCANEEHLEDLVEKSFQAIVSLGGRAHAHHIRSIIHRGDVVTGKLLDILHQRGKIHRALQAPGKKKMIWAVTEDVAS
jgi:hypothetical protein